MTKDGVLGTSVSALQTMLRERSVSSVELTETFLERISDANKSLNAVVTVCAEQALEQAQEADAALGRAEYQSLTGIPILHKDIFAPRACTPHADPGC